MDASKDASMTHAVTGGFSPWPIQRQSEDAQVHRSSVDPGGGEREGEKRKK
jgi:hypothetical protein